MSFSNDYVNSMNIRDDDTIINLGHPSNESVEILSSSDTREKKEKPLYYLETEHIDRLFSYLESVRTRYNDLIFSSQNNPDVHKNNDSLYNLAEVLYTVSLKSFRNMALSSHLLDAVQLNSSVVNSPYNVYHEKAPTWLKNLMQKYPNESQIPSNGYHLTYNDKGLRVFRKDLDNNRILVRGEFIVPLTPQQYISYSSDFKMRQTWDKNVSESSLIEKYNENMDVMYVVYKRIASFYPRDCVNLRLIRCVNKFKEKNIELGEVVKKNNPINEIIYNSPEFHSEHETNEENDMISESFSLLKNSYCSCSCSLIHPSKGDISGRVRADLKIGSYLVEPLLFNEETHCGNWSKVYMVSEVDPRGWIPSSLSKTIAVKILPKTIDKIVDCLLANNKISWKGIPFRHTITKDTIYAETSLDYCILKYQGLI